MIGRVCERHLFALSNKQGGDGAAQQEIEIPQQIVVDGFRHYLAPVCVGGSA
jgi:hypothetical protein